MAEFWSLQHLQQTPHVFHLLQHIEQTSSTYSMQSCTQRHTSRLQQLKHIEHNLRHPQHTSNALQQLQHIAYTIYDLIAYRNTSGTFRKQSTFSAASSIQSST
jgi:hypothetical protein